MLPKHLPLLLLLSLINWSLIGQNFSGGFNFYLPPYDGTSQEFLPEFPAKTIESFVKIDENGHFEVDNEPIRFWGANLSDGGCFPPKGQSRGIANRMRKMGLNLIRFHHMDNPWTGNDGTIFDRNSGNTRNLDPITLDRFHFLINELKQQNIYANINLHVSRTFSVQDGVIHADSITEFGKAVTFFDPQLISLQKEYAQQLLTTVNPHSGLALVDDPVMAMVEITNENTLYGFWRGNHLQPISKGGLLIQRHANLLDDLWNDFLLEKYSTNIALEEAWNTTGQSAEGINQSRDNGFESGTISQDWRLEVFGSASATYAADPVNPYSGNYAGRVNVNQVTQTEWHIQLIQGGLSIEKDSSYILTFNARADRARSINIGIMQDAAPWDWYGGTSINLTPEWQTFTFTLTAPTTNLGQTRININFANQAGTVWFDEFQFGQPVPIGLMPNEILTNQSIKRIPYRDRALYNDKRGADMAEFYLGIQKDYYEEMYRYLKEDLGVKVPITGSNALIGPQDVMTMESLDYVDDHAYWDHPWFPNEPWSSTDWVINNQPMLTQDNLGTLSNLFSGLAIEGKPYTISEYNHPFPNRYLSEMLPMLTTIASFRDTDGIMFFDYNSGNPNDWTSDILPGYFSIHRNNAIMALMPLFAKVYRSKLIPVTVNNQLSIEYSEESIYTMPQKDNFGRWGQYLPYNGKLGLQYNIRTTTFSAATDNIENLPSPSSTIEPLIVEGAQAFFDTDLGAMEVQSEHFVTITGALNQYQSTVPGALNFINGNGIGTLAWLSLTDEPLVTTSKSLIGLSSRQQNTGMTWNGTNSVSNNWGSAPTLIEPLAIEFEVQLDTIYKQLSLCPLNAVGATQNCRIYGPTSPGLFKVRLDQAQDKTLWYGLSPGLNAVSTSGTSAFKTFEVFPNPATQQTTILIGTHRALEGQLRITNIAGKLVYEQALNIPANTDTSIQFNIENYPAGYYQISINSAHLVKSKRLLIKK